MSRPKRVAIYCRVSKRGDQTNENQLLRLRPAVERDGDIIVDEYCDESSAADMRRPELARMMKDVRKGKIDVVLVLRIDRIMRSLLNMELILQEITQAGAIFRALDQQIDTSTAMGRMFQRQISMMAEWEREMNSERTLDGLARARAQGRVGGNPGKELTEYQIEKAKSIIAENPGISQRALASHFKTVGRSFLIRELRELGIWRR